MKLELDVNLNLSEQHLREVAEESGFYLVPKEAVKVINVTSLVTTRMFPREEILESIRRDHVRELARYIADKGAKEELREVPGHETMTHTVLIIAPDAHCHAGSRQAYPEEKAT